MPFVLFPSICFFRDCRNMVSSIFDHVTMVWIEGSLARLGLQKQQPRTNVDSIEDSTIGVAAFRDDPPCVVRLKLCQVFEYYLARFHFIILYGNLLKLLNLIDNLNIHPIGAFILSILFARSRFDSWA